jgi:hypothetical protein
MIDQGGELHDIFMQSNFMQSNVLDAPLLGRLASLRLR